MREHPYPHFPVQLLHDVIAQPGERHPALRAAVPAAGKIPDHLDPGQMRVIPAPRPRPGPPRPAARQVPARAPAVLIPGRRRPRPLRRPPEHQPLQHSQLRAQPLKLGLPERVTLPQPGILLPKPRILRCQTLRQPRQPLIRLQRRRQHILQQRVSIRLRDHASPGNHGAQQTRP